MNEEITMKEVEEIPKKASGGRISYKYRHIFERMNAQDFTVLELTTPLGKNRDGIYNNIKLLIKKGNLQDKVIVTRRKEKIYIINKPK